MSGSTERAVAASSRCCHPGITRARPGWCRGGSGWNGYRSGTHSTTHDRRRRHHDAGIPQGLGEDSGGHGCSHGTSICGIPRRCQPSARTVSGADRRRSGWTGCRTGGALRTRHAPPVRRHPGWAQCARRRPARETPPPRARNAAGSGGVSSTGRRPAANRRLDATAADVGRPRRHGRREGRSRADGGVGEPGATRPDRTGGRRRRRGPGRCSRSRRASRRAHRGRCSRCGRRRPARRRPGPRARRGCRRT